MTVPTGLRGAVRFLAVTGAWAIGLTALWSLSFVAATGGGLPSLRSVLSVAPVTLAFASFGGGVATVLPGATVGMRRGSAIAATVLAVSAWGLLAYAEPLASFAAATPAEASQLYPFGAETPAGLEALRQAQLESPPDNPRPSLDQPRLRAASWVDYTIQEPRIYGVFVLLNGLLGYVVALISLGQAPGRRRRLRWLLGIASAYGFMIADGLVRGQIAANPVGSGVARSWLGVLGAHALVLLLLVVLARLRPNDRR